MFILISFKKLFLKLNSILNIKNLNIKKKPNKISEIINVII